MNRSLDESLNEAFRCGFNSVRFLKIGEQILVHLQNETGEVEIGDGQCALGDSAAASLLVALENHDASEYAETIEAAS